MINLIAWIVSSALLAAAVPAKAKDSSPEARRALSAAAGQALQGNIKQALAELRSIPSSEFGTSEARIRACMIERFSPEADGSLPRDFGPFTNRAVGIYRAYWRAALLRPENKASEEERLHRNLARLTGLQSSTDLNRIQEEIKTHLAAEGVHVLMGRTPPLLELMVWDTESSEVRDVPLPEGNHSVTVKILDDFASLGWSAYATCDRSFTGGWVRPDGIYAVKPGWKSLEDENFRISFRAHETQHFADKERFGALESWELEYRGKLAELALAETTIPRLLSAFASNQGDDPAVPHSFANKRVLTDLRRQLELGPSTGLSEIPVHSINEAARVLLLRDSEQRRAGTGG